MPGSPKWSLSLRFHHQNPVYASPLPPIRATCPAPAAAPPLPPHHIISKLKKKTNFVDTMIFNILCDLLFNRNQPLKLADDQYVRILENNIKTYNMLDKI